MVFSDISPRHDPEFRFGKKSGIILFVTPCLAVCSKDGTF